MYSPPFFPSWLLLQIQGAYREMAAEPSKRVDTSCPLKEPVGGICQETPSQRISAGKAGALWDVALSELVSFRKFSCTPLLYVEEWLRFIAMLQNVLLIFKICISSTFVFLTENRATLMISLETSLLYGGAGTAVGLQTQVGKE